MVLVCCAVLRGAALAVCFTFRYFMASFSLLKSAACTEVLAYLLMSRALGGLLKRVRSGTFYSTYSYIQYSYCSYGVRRYG